MFWHLGFARTTALVAVLVTHSMTVSAETVLGEEPALGSGESRITQAELAAGVMSLSDIRLAGLKMFATAFRHADGYGDGPLNSADPTTAGGRPMLQNNGTFLRVNGLDGQACLDCHGLISADTMPPTTGIGGAGGINNSPMFKTRAIDVADAAGNGFAGFDGRLINPPALFGTGGVQQLGKEITAKLQWLKAWAIRYPGTVVQLRAKGVSFGHIVADGTGRVDTSNVEGIDSDLVLRPFGRKGEFTTVREFDLDALMFHFGMQPTELVGDGVDADGDGVVNEVNTGEVSALSMFITTQERPVMLPVDNNAWQGFRTFNQLGCAACHKPSLKTNSPILNFSFPEVPTDPAANVFYSVDLREPPMNFKPADNGGVMVPLFSDLKRHDMGAALAENFHLASAQQNREFITAKLWGVADTAPYLHDGRALTLNEAILLHGGEAATARNNYAALAVDAKNNVIRFLRSLRNPRDPNADVVN